MTNNEIAGRLNLLGKLLELHGTDAFKTKAYTNAYLSLRKWPDPVSAMSPEQISEISGIGKAMQAKIRELVNTGEMQALNDIMDRTPIGLQELIQIKGLGVKKLKVIWQNLGIESCGELLNAINDNRLVDLKGFGAKTQQTLKEQLEYHLESANKYLYAQAEPIAQELLELIQAHFPDETTALTGSVHRCTEIIETIDLLSTATTKKLIDLLNQQDTFTQIHEQYYYRNIKLNIHKTERAQFYLELARTSTSEVFWKKLSIEQGIYNSESEVFTKNDLPYYLPEFRESANVNLVEKYKGPQGIIELDQIHGCIHNHSTYSDGVNSLREMALAAQDSGHDYFVITDHSQSAFYANGLEIARLQQQMEEVRELDQELTGLRCFSGTESDILSDGRLDYPDEILADLDLIVASIHSNLRMDKSKATTRLIRAIENPYTSILGHMTGRLLLTRKAYPVDYQKVIDACADNGVAIELNANPRRLDMDWRWIDYALSKEVLISINPDAHSIAGIDDTKYGVLAARKAALPTAYCLNAMEVDEFEEWLMDQHSKRP